MIDIKIKDVCFAHANCIGSGDLKIYPSYFNWYRGNESRDICFFTDTSLQQITNQSNSFCKINVAWLMEPPSINSTSYQWIRDNHQFFEYVLTHNKEILSIDKKFVWFPHGGCWISPEDYGVYPKTQNVSIIASDKNFTSGHMLRHEVIDLMKDKIDLVCGRGYQPFDYKLDALKDYKYSIIIENGKFETYFTEKIIDCFMTGTIPIYWGCSLKGLFDESGVLCFNTTDELNDILTKIRTGDIRYEDMNKSVQKNFETAKEYTITEDWVFKNIIEKEFKQ